MKLFLTCIITLLFIQLHAQYIEVYKRDSAFISASGTKVLYLGDSIIPGVSLPFKSFIFKDVRADTSCIGTRIKKTGRNEHKRYDKITLSGATTIALEDYFNNHLLFKQDSVNLYCFIKQLRLTRVDTIGKNDNGRYGVYQRLRFSVECYLEKGNLYFPALRLDTMVTSFDLKSSDYDILPEALNLLAIKASSLNTEKCFRKKAYTSEEIEKRYFQRFEKPILTAAELRKGVYLTFAEFLNNNPSITAYEFLKDKKATILYTKDNSGKFVPETNVFGFCDGKVVWLNVDNTFRPLIRQGKTFGFVATLNAYSEEKSGKRSTVNYVQMNNDLATASATAIATALSNTIDAFAYSSRSIVYELDMESGNYY